MSVRDAGIEGFGLLAGIVAVIVREVRIARRNRRR